MVLIYYIILLDNRDFLFESTLSIVSLYIYLVDDSFYLVIARNNIDKPIVLPRYLYLDTVLEIDYDNYYITATNKTNFTILNPTF